MNVIFLDSERTNRPSILLTQPSDFGLDKLCDIPYQHLLAILGTPHEMKCYLIGDMFSMLFFHAIYYSMVYHGMREQKERRLTPAVIGEGNAAAISSNPTMAHILFCI